MRTHQPLLRKTAVRLGIARENVSVYTVTEVHTQSRYTFCQDSRVFLGRLSPAYGRPSSNPRRDRQPLGLENGLASALYQKNKLENEHKLRQRNLRHSRHVVSTSN